MGVSLLTCAGLAALLLAVQPDWLLAFLPQAVVQAVQQRLAFVVRANAGLVGRWSTVVRVEVEALEGDLQLFGGNK